MTTSTLPKRFTVQIGDHLIDLPEADTRDEALRKIGLTPRHWPEKPAIKRQQGKATAKRVNKPHSTTSNVTTGKRSGMSTKSAVDFIENVTQTPKTVTVTVTHTPKYVIRNANCNANYCLFCGKPITALRKTKHYCNSNCRVKKFRNAKK